MLFVVSVEEFNVQSLLLMTEATILELIPKAGPRQLFEHHLKVLKESQTDKSNVSLSFLLFNFLFFLLTLNVAYCNVLCVRLMITIMVITIMVITMLITVLILVLVMAILLCRLT